MPDTRPAHQTTADQLKCDFADTCPNISRLTGIGTVIYIYGRRGVDSPNERSRQMATLNMPEQDKHERAWVEPEIEELGSVSDLTQAGAFPGRDRTQIGKT